MGKSVIIVLFAFVFLIAFVSSAELLRQEEIYFKICGDTRCDVNTASFDSSQNVVYIRAYEFENAALSGEVVRPDGSVLKLNFNNFFSQDDYDSVNINGDGTYIGSVRAEREGYYDFDKTFRFYVGKKGEIVDLSKILCSDVSDVEKKGEDSFEFDGGFNPIRDSVPVAQFYQNVRSSLSTSSWSSWSCPPNNLERGQTCYPTLKKDNLLGYFPNEGNGECFGSVSGEYKSGRVNRKILPVSKTLEDSMAGLAFKLKSESKSLKCETGCYKKVSLDVSESEVIDGFFTRTELLVYDYKIECVSLGDSANWKVEGVVNEKKMCLNEREKLALSDSGSCKSFCPVPGAQICSGKGFRVCGDFDGNGCFEWGEESVCSDGKVCELGQCLLPKKVIDDEVFCSNECSISGEKRCSGNGVETCGNFDADSCLEWSIGKECTQGEICSDGTCLEGLPVGCIDKDGDGFGSNVDICGVGRYDCNDDDASVYKDCGECPVCDNCNGLSSKVSGGIPFDSSNYCSYLNGDFILRKQPLDDFYYPPENSCSWRGTDNSNNQIGFLYCQNGYWKWREVAKAFEGADRTIVVTSLRAVEPDETCPPLGEFTLSGECLPNGGNLAIYRYEI